MQWPDQSSDLTAPDFFLWDYLKEKSLAEDFELLKERIRYAIREVQPETIQRVMINFQSCMQQCIENHGTHLIDVLFTNLTDDLPRPVV